MNKPKKKTTTPIKAKTKPRPFSISNNDIHIAVETSEVTEQLVTAILYNSMALEQLTRKVTANNVSAIKVGIVDDE